MGERERAEVEKTGTPMEAPYRITALKMILVGEIKKHIELNDSKYALDNAGTVQ